MAGYEFINVREHRGDSGLHGGIAGLPSMRIGPADPMGEAGNPSTRDRPDVLAAIVPAVEGPLPGDPGVSARTAGQARPSPVHPPHPAPPAPLVRPRPAPLSPPGPSRRSGADP